MTSLPNRHNNRWNVNEVLTLEREYELLRMNIQDISTNHERTVDAILFKLQREGIITNWNEARGYQNFVDEQLKQTIINGSLEDDADEDDEDYYPDESMLAQRVSSLETSVNDIKEMLTTLLNKSSATTKTSRLHY